MSNFTHDLLSHVESYTEVENIVIAQTMIIVTSDNNH